MKTLTDSARLYSDSWEKSLNLGIISVHAMFYKNLQGGETHEKVDEA